VPGDRAPGFLASSRGRAFRALAHEPFRLLFIAFLMNQTGFWISHIGMQGLMVELSHNEPLWLGLLFFALFIPAFALAPLAGVAADCFDRKRIMLRLCRSRCCAALTATRHLGPPPCSRLPRVRHLLYSAGPRASRSRPTRCPTDMPSAVAPGREQSHARMVGPVAAPFVANHYMICFHHVPVRFVRLRGADRDERPPLRQSRRVGSSRGSRSVPHARNGPGFLRCYGRDASLFGVSHSAILPCRRAGVGSALLRGSWWRPARAMLGAISIGYREEPRCRGRGADARYSAAMGVCGHAC
jgi:hypothetical protein